MCVVDGKIRSAWIKGTQRHCFRPTAGTLVLSNGTESTLQHNHPCLAKRMRQRTGHIHLIYEILLQLLRSRSGVWAEFQGFAILFVFMPFHMPCLCLSIPETFAIAFAIAILPSNSCAPLPFSTEPQSMGPGASPHSTIVSLRRRRGCDPRAGEMHSVVKS